MKSIRRSAARIDIDVTDDQLTGRAGYTFLAEQAERLGLASSLKSAIKIKQRQ